MCVFHRYTRFGVLVCAMCRALIEPTNKVAVRRGMVGVPYTYLIFDSVSRVFLNIFPNVWVIAVLLFGNGCFALMI